MTKALSPKNEELFDKKAAEMIENELGQAGKLLKVFGGIDDVIAKVKEMQMSSEGEKIVSSIQVLAAIMGLSALNLVQKEEAEALLEKLNDLRKELSAKGIEIKQLNDEVIAEAAPSDASVSPAASSKKVKEEVPAHLNIEANKDLLKPAENFYSALKGPKPERESFLSAYIGFRKLSVTRIKNQQYLTIFNVEESNKEPRLSIINMDTKTVEYDVPAGHGSGSGGEFASAFSNDHGSYETSLGFVLTGDNYESNSKETREGIRLFGLENSINDQTDERAIFIHPGTVAGSKGCITLPHDAKDIMDKIKGGSLIHVYYPDNEYFADSKIINEKIAVA